MESVMKEHTVTFNNSDKSLKEVATKWTALLGQLVSVRDVEKMLLMWGEECEVKFMVTDSRPVPPLLLTFWQAVDSFLEKDPSLNFSRTSNEVAFQMSAIKKLLTNEGWDLERIKSARRLLIFESPHPLLKKNHSKKHHISKRVARCWIFKRINKAG